jgi:hypothetical protein
MIAFSTSVFAEGLDLDVNLAGGNDVGDSAVAQDDSTAIDVNDVANGNDLSNNQQANSSFNDSSNNSDNSESVYLFAHDSFNNESDNSDNSDNSDYNEQKVEGSYNADADNSFNDNSTNASGNAIVNATDNNLMIALMEMEANGDVGLRIGGAEGTGASCAPTEAAVANGTGIADSGNGFAGINSMDTTTGFNNNAGAQTVVGFTVSGGFQSGVQTGAPQ